MSGGGKSAQKGGSSIIKEVFYRVMDITSFLDFIGVKSRGKDRAPKPVLYFYKADGRYL